MPVEYSFVLAGKYGVGKTSIFKKLKTGHAPEGITEGSSRNAFSYTTDDGGLENYFYEREINGRKIKVGYLPIRLNECLIYLIQQVTLWDTGGQERYESMTANYYRNANAVILVYALDEESTFYSLNELVAEAKDVNRLGDQLVLAAWGSKSDLPAFQKTVKEDSIAALSSKFKIPNELNCKVNVFDDSVERAMRTLTEYVDQMFASIDTSNDDVMTLDRTEPNPSQPRNRCCDRF